MGCNTTALCRMLGRHRIENEDQDRNQTDGQFTYIDKIKTELVSIP